MSEKRNTELLRVLIDAVSMLEHYAQGRPSNWDGSTERQAFATINEARQLIAGDDPDKKAELIVINPVEEDTTFLLDLNHAVTKDLDDLAFTTSLDKRDFYEVEGRLLHRHRVISDYLHNVRQIKPENISNPEFYPELETPQ